MDRNFLPCNKSPITTHINRLYSSVDDARCFTSTESVILHAPGYWIQNYYFHIKSPKISKGQSEAVNLRRTDNTNLTRKRFNLVRKLNQHRKRGDINSYWTQDGRIIVKPHETSDRRQFVTVTSESDIYDTLGLTPLSVQPNDTNIWCQFPWQWCVSFSTL